MERTNDIVVNPSASKMKMAEKIVDDTQQILKQNCLVLTASKTSMD